MLQFLRYRRVLLLRLVQEVVDGIQIVVVGEVELALGPKNVLVRFVVCTEY